MRESLFQLLEKLHPREREVLLLRYGLVDGRCKSLDEIGKLFDASKEWIRRNEKAALSKIRKEDIHRAFKYFLHS